MMMDTGIRGRSAQTGMPWGFIISGVVVALLLMCGIWVMTASPTIQQHTQEIPLEKVNS